MSSIESRVLFFVAISFACLITVVHLSAVRNDANEKDFKENAELVFSHVLFRHGDRNPRKRSPFDKYDITYFPEGWGQITNLGKQQLYALGKWLRIRYNKFLNVMFNVNDIYIKSTDTDRTLMSAQVILAGLYPPKKNQIWNKDLLWQPIPIHSQPEEMDHLITGDVTSSCTAYQNAFNAYLMTEEMIKFFASIQPLYDYISERSGTVLKDYMTLLAIGDSLLCEKAHGLELPEWAKQLYPNNESFNQTLIKSLYAGTATKFLAKFTIGFLVEDILNRFTSKSQNTLSPDRKLWMYSTHDSAIFSFLNALNISDNKLVPYTAAVLVELKLYKHNYYVQVFYKNSDREPDPINIPGCGIACPLSKMYEMYDDILPKNEFNIECQIGE